VAVQVALLRGINLAGNRRVSMPELRGLLDERGFGPVRTYLQSGNVVLESDLPEAELAAALRDVIGSELGLGEIPVIVRSRDDLARVVALDPLREHATVDKLYQVTFLSAPAPGDLEGRLRAALTEPERVHVDGREVYTWHPHGAQASRLWRLLADRRLGVEATARNWRTVTTLMQMADGHAG
jgi:uncharacterized protein (DUF1697 family)